MLTHYPINLQIQQIVTSLETNIQRFHDTLNELRRLSLALFQETRVSDSDIENWFREEEFAVDQDGFWLRVPLLKAFRKNKAPRNAISHSWHPDLVQNREACTRMYCLRNIGPFLDEIRSRLPHAAWVYYQDITNTSIQFPYIDQITAITPDFDWTTYHTFQSVTPENNPGGRIQWTRPTIDYAGQGIILSVSIPLELEGKFIGLWSIDLPMASLYPDFIFDTLLQGQVNFIIDQGGRLVAHPSIETAIDLEKGSIFQQHFHDLGPEFKGLNPDELLEQKKGQFALTSTREGTDLIAYFEVIPGIQWIFFSTFPRQSMEDAVNQRIRMALDRVRSGDFSYRLDNPSSIEEVKSITNAYNEMALALENQEKIRERVQSEKERLEARLQHFQKMEAMGTLAGGIAHDFNNILSPIMGYSELLLMDVSKESPNHKMLHQIYMAASRAKDLTRQILTFSRQEELNNQVVRFQIIIKEALKLLRSSIPRDIEILNNIQPDCAKVFADPTRLHQIVMNLCTNAFHAVQENSGKIEVCLEEVIIVGKDEPGMEGLVPGRYARLTVSDSGCGMDARILAQIFDPYFTTKKEGKGTGLGLSVTYGIVRKLNGDIKVYSEPGRGTTFHVFLPTVDVPEESKKPLEESVAEGTERILFIDDEENIAVMGREILQKYGYHVSIYKDSIQALNAFKESPEAFDLVVTDMAMPGMTGDILARHLKACKKDIPVILCTGFSEKISRATYHESDIDEFLMKPFSIGKFIGTVRKILDSRG